MDQFQVALHPFGGPEAVLAYLSRYTHRVAVSNHRLVSAESDTVVFRWKDYRIKQGDRMKIIRLPTGEFIRRFLIHVLPPSRQIVLQSPAGLWSGLHRIRHYGFLAGAGRKEKVTKIRALLGDTKTAQPEQTCEETQTPLTLREPCPDCGGPMRIIETFRRGQIPRTPTPPRKQAA